MSHGPPGQPLNDRFPTIPLANFNAEKLQQQENGGCEINVPKPEPWNKGWGGPPTNDKDDPLASSLILVAS